MRILITTATLTFDVGSAAVEQARKTAGIDCDVFVSVDPLGQGGCKTANIGWKKALDEDYDYLVYLNDDVTITQSGWLRRMIEVLEERDNRGIAVTGGVCNTYPQNTGKPGLPEKVIDVPMAAFFTVVIKRAVLESIGLLDDDFIHFGCDSDYVERAKRFGWKIVYIQDIYVIHDHLEVKDRPQKIRNWKRRDTTTFFDRWGYK